MAVAYTKQNLSIFHKMIDKNTLINIISWFKSYANNFQSSNKTYQQNINLKKDHTYRVYKEITRLGKSLNLNKGDLNLAKAIAILHDVGRFEQYEHYRTFSDSKSEDHAKLGIKIICQNQVLKELDKPTSELILRTISYHNHPTLPQNETKRCLFFTKMLRDADKLDILYVVTEYYRNSNEYPNDSLKLELPDSPQMSAEVYNDLMSGRTVNARHLRTLNDLKLLQMAWIYDINFSLTFQLIRQRGYMEKIRDVLPQSDKVQKIYSKVKSYLDKNCKSYHKIINL